MEISEMKLILRLAEAGKGVIDKFFHIIPCPEIDPNGDNCP